MSWRGALPFLVGFAALAVRTVLPRDALPFATIPAPPRATFPPPRAVGVHFCEPLRDQEAQRVTDESGEGPELIGVLNARDVCLDAGDLPSAGGYFVLRRRPNRQGMIAFIVVARRLVMSARADELAALLVHDATHARMRFDGSDCLIGRWCTLLGNGVALEDKTAAHMAESEWLGVLDGPSGASFRGGTEGAFVSAGENRLLAYLETGSDDFAREILSVRSDPV